MKISSLAVRAGFASMPATAFAPAIGSVLTGYGSPWLVLPIGSVVAIVGGTCAEKREAAARRVGVVVSDPDLDELRETLTAPRDEITVEYRWSDAA